MTKRAEMVAYAIAYAWKQIEPDVVAAYPITPQSPIVEKFSEYVQKGEVKTEMILAESEHSAISACVGASASGARAFTATCSQGLALMHEILHIASGLRLPILMNIANRALSAPINIHCDHSDTMNARDAGWIQFYCEHGQEAYETTFFALKLAENVNLPAMVCMDGFITSHSVEVIDFFEEEGVKRFVGERKPLYSLLDFKNPVTVGPLQLPDSYFETKIQQERAMEKVLEVFPKIAREFKERFGRKMDYVEEYKTKDAEEVMVCLSSTAGTAKEAIDRLRKEGRKVGLIKIRLYRPFNYRAITKRLKDKKVIVLDRALSFGAFPPLYSDIKIALEGRGEVYSYVYGLGGREITSKEIEKVFENVQNKKVKENAINYLGSKINQRCFRNPA